MHRLNLMIQNLCNIQAEIDHAFDTRSEDVIDIVQRQNWLYYSMYKIIENSLVLKMCYVVRLLTVRQITFLCMMFQSKVK